MSRWRREASERLPELQSMIAAKHVNGPMMLWIELSMKFRFLCEEEQPPIDLLRRIWHYFLWCVEHGNQDLLTAAVVGFCENLIDTKEMIQCLPEIMTRSTFLDFRNVLEYSNTPEEVDQALEIAWGKSRESNRD